MLFICFDIFANALSRMVNNVEHEVLIHAEFSSGIMLDELFFGALCLIIRG